MARGAWDGTLSGEEFERAAMHFVTIWERRCPDLPQWTWQRSQNRAISPIPGRVCGYLALQDVRVSSIYEDCVEKLDEPDGDDYDDHSSMYEGLVGDHEQHLYTYHVAYNESYRVPMLLLQGRLPDGRPLQWNSVLRDLPVESQHISTESRWTFLTQEMLPEVAGLTIEKLLKILEDHPVLHRPWFALHPCGTSEIMSLVFSDAGAPESAAYVSEVPVPGELSAFSAAQERQVSSESRAAPAAEGGDGWKSCIAARKVSSRLEKYILTWMSFACPAVGLAVPSQLFVERKCCK